MVHLDALCLSFTIASLSILGAWTQSPPPPPPCVQACSVSAAKNASCSITDVNCICNSSTFVKDVSSCILSSCSSTDAVTALEYFETLCSRANSSLSSSVSLSCTSSTGSVSTSASGSGSGASIAPSGLSTSAGGSGSGAIASSGLSSSASGSVSGASPSSGSSSGSLSLSSGSSSGSSPSSPSPSSSESVVSSTAERSTVSSTTSGASQSSTRTINISFSPSGSFVTPTTTPVSHAVRGHTVGSFAGAGFVLALVVALVAW